LRLKLSIHNIKPRTQYYLSIGLIVFVTVICLALSDFMGYRVVAFILLFAVSILAMLVDIIPVILAAFLSALFWDLLFIPPRFTFTVGTVEDRWLLLMYFVIALVHAVLTSKIRKMEQEIRIREEKARAVKFYNTVFNSLTHELRTPITTIVGATDNLLTDNSRISDEVKKELLLEINVAALRLNRQVENLLSMSRLESGIIKANKNWVDVRELVYNTLKEFETQTNGHRISVNVADQLPLFKLDYGLMEQVIHNLINNAIQHTPERTDIIINVDVSEEKLVLTLSDTGKGFPSKDIDRVFDKFYRVSGSKAGGTGLGLSIVRGFVEAHHGTIALRNLPLSGAEFSIVIPTEITYINKLKNE
jgi:two-component system sensor histidine kinase KdpD